MYGSKPSPRKSNSFRKPNGYRANGNGSMPPTPRRNSVGCATPELLTPRSYSGRQNGYFRETRRLSTTPLNFVAISKEDTMSTYASVCGSESGSPRLNWKTGNWYVTMFCLFLTFLLFVLFCCCAFHLLQWNLGHHTVRHMYTTHKHAIKLHFSGVQNIKSGFNRINTTMVIGILIFDNNICAGQATFYTFDDCTLS